MIKLLSCFGKALEEEDLDCEMLLCGGAIFVINGDREYTEDIDCMFDKQGVLYSIRDAE